MQIRFIQGFFGTRPLHKERPECSKPSPLHVLGAHEAILPVGSTPSPSDKVGGRGGRDVTSLHYCKEGR